MEQIFKDFTAWFWPFIGNIFSTVGDFFGDIGMSLYENSNTILPVLAYMFVSALGLFALMKLFQYAITFFSSLTKQSILGTVIKGGIALFLLWFLASLAVYINNSI